MKQKKLVQFYCFPIFEINLKGKFRDVDTKILHHKTKKKLIVERIKIKKKTSECS